MANSLLRFAANPVSLSIMVFFMFFCEESFAYRVKYMNKSRTLCTFFPIKFLNGHSMRFVPHEWSAACAVNMFMKLSKCILGVGVGEFGRFVC